MDLGIKIRKIRQDKNIKQSDLAYFLGINQSTLSKLESGFATISVDCLIKIAKYTQTPIYSFFSDEFVELVQKNQNIYGEDSVSQKEQNIQLLKIIDKLEKELELLKSSL